MLGHLWYQNNLSHEVNLVDNFIVRNDDIMIPALLFEYLKMLEISFFADMSIFLIFTNNKYYHIIRCKI